MALAVKNASEAVPSPGKSPLERLAVSGLVGAVYILGSIGLVFYAIPELWRAIFSGSVEGALGSFVDVALMIVVMIAAAIGLGVTGIRWLAGHSAHGLKAGVFTAAVGILGIAWLTWWVGTLLEEPLSAASVSESSRLVGTALTLAVGVGLFVLAGYWFFRPSTEEYLASFEDQGWFTAQSYKKSQGRLVRRGTIVGILAIAGTGIWTLLSHHTLETGPKDWAFVIPFAGGRQFTALADVRFTVPLLLAAASLWLAYRFVNLPVFADFLIATEAELNKVSWTTRKRLVQDTIVVLTCVILLTLFLFFVDVLWGWILSSRYIGVLQVDQGAQQQQEQKEQPW